MTKSCHFLFRKMSEQTLEALVLAQQQRIAELEERQASWPCRLVTRIELMLCTLRIYVDNVLFCSIWTQGNAWGIIRIEHENGQHAICDRAQNVRLVDGFERFLLDESVYSFGLKWQDERDYETEPSFLVIAEPFQTYQIYPVFLYFSKTSEYLLGRVSEAFAMTEEAENQFRDAVYDLAARWALE